VGLEAGSQLKSQGKWLGVVGTFLWDFTYLCWNLTNIVSLITDSFTTTGTTIFFTITNRFFFGFDFVAFGFPYWWYPDYYYGYPYDYASYDYSPVYDYRYWYGLVTAVQTELARRGYYHGPIDGLMGSDSREAIRAFQRAQGLPVTRVIDPVLPKSFEAACCAARCGV
jgi:hypothetical protein